MATQKKPRLEDYFAGAALANSLVWLTLGITTLFETNPQDLALLSPFLYAVGSTVSGYLVSRKATQNQLRVGLKTGLSAFVFHVYVWIGLFELFLGTRVLSLIDHLLILAILIAGAALGSLLCKKLCSDNKTDQSIG